VWLEHGTVAAWAPKPNGAPRRTGSAPTTKRSWPKLVSHIEAAIDRYRAGEIDAYALDETIHHYHRAAAALWKFCFARGGGTHAAFIAGLLDRMTAGAEPIDWWERATPRRHQRSRPHGAPGASAQAATDRGHSPTAIQRPVPPARRAEPGAMVSVARVSVARRPG
jgi:hypothetical protein